MSTQRKKTKLKTTDYFKLSPIISRGYTGKNALNTWAGILLTRCCTRKKSLSLAFIGLIMLSITWKGLLYNVSEGSRPMPTYTTPFPNIGTLSAQGKDALGSLPVLELPVSCPSQVTFVIPLSNRDVLGAIPLIVRLQDMKCLVHFLVEPGQVRGTIDFLEVMLPAMEHISVFQKEKESGGIALATLHHAKSVETPWVWIMGPLDSDSRTTLSGPDFMSIFQRAPTGELPIGIHGARLYELKLFCTPRTSQPEPVAFLAPPFVAPTLLLRQAELGIVSDTSADVWASLGERIASITGFGMGGALFPTISHVPSSCEASHTWMTRDHEKVSEFVIDSLDTQIRSSIPGALHFAFTLPDMQSMHLLAPTVCRMLQNGHDMYISIKSSGTDSSSPKDWMYADLGCHLHYHLDTSLPREAGSALTHAIRTWCLSETAGAKVLVITELNRESGREAIPIAKRFCSSAAAIINLPYSDLQGSEWLAMLTPEEWQAWNIPEIELAVITHDRPWSLTRLLGSIQEAHYFGDPVNIVINLEQTADLETHHIAETFSMNLDGGHVAVRHRIVYAGLMAAVVESWYPRGNHSYGVILEDDVELSPMFYAWAKFCVLRYRYNSKNNQSSQLYGVSLYQPKVTELRMEGRRPFDPKTMFTNLRLKHPHTPYLSQVPCSWGAVYFPEHWREFQRYLSLRLSGHTMPVDDLVVPDLRSNKWSRSWKKFFNEMVFLRGYVSLYPNYNHSVSLSTNHLEKGEHVPANINEEKQKDYFLPLMQDTANARLHPGTARGVKLLDLPLANLPKWSTLPVLDLWGNISSLEQLQAAGLARRTEMSVCGVEETHQDALQFLCPSNGSALEELRKPANPVKDDDDSLDLMQG